MRYEKYEISDIRNRRYEKYEIMRNMRYEKYEIWEKGDMRNEK